MWFLTECILTWNGLSWGKEFASEIILICVISLSLSRGHWIPIFQFPCLISLLRPGFAAVWERRGGVQIWLSVLQSSGVCSICTSNEEAPATIMIFLRVIRCNGSPISVQVVRPWNLKNRWIQNADPFPGSMCKIVTDLATGESLAVSGSCVLFHRTERACPEGPKKRKDYYDNTNLVLFLQIFGFPSF